MASCCTHPRAFCRSPRTPLPNRGLTHPQASFPPHPKPQPYLELNSQLFTAGPMLNPAHAAYGLVGVYSTSVSHLMADSLQVRIKGCC